MRTVWIPRQSRLTDRRAGVRTVEPLNGMSDGFQFLMILIRLEKYPRSPKIQGRQL